MGMSTAVVVLGVSLLCFGICYGQEKCNRDIDLGFILDSSGSLKADYQKEKDFLKAVVNNFQISYRKTRAGVITFSFNAEHSIKLNKHGSVGYFMRAVDDIPHMGSNTRTDKALRLAQRQMFNQRNGGRETAPNVLILITDGAQTPDTDAEDPGDIADEMRKVGVTVIVVGIGRRTDEGELGRIAGKDGKVYHVESFKDLMTLDVLDGVTKAACVRDAPRPIGPVENKCMRDNGGCEHLCVNYYGAYECKCKKGFKLMEDKERCQDIDECALYNGGCNMLCENSHGSYECRCRKGFKLGSDKKTCSDLNECDTRNGGCDQICVNKMGSHQCACMAGFEIQDDKRTCQDIDECENSNGGCQQLCRNRPGSFYCRCKPGYKLSTNKKGCTRVVVPGSRNRNAVSLTRHYATIDGGWSEWTSFTQCTRSCGGGRQMRTRSCSNPAPMNGGRLCVGDAIQHDKCNTQQCQGPVHGNWGSWSLFTRCTLTCDGGMQERTRECNNPRPDRGGRPCAGNDVHRRKCNTVPCPVPIHGSWGRWKPMERCSQTCEGGVQTFRRRCEDPTPANGGRDCTGPAYEQRECNQNVVCVDPTVPIDGNWGQWNEWEACSRKCGGGSRRRTRSCDKPQPQFGGRDCRGYDFEEARCNEQKCPIDGNWGQWTIYTPCTRTCGMGRNRRTRKCNSPRPRYGGLKCRGPSVDEQLCGPRDCPPEDPAEMARKAYRERMRLRPTQGTYVRGADRVENPVHGNWGDWSAFTRCTRTCGGGKKIRTRSCNNPAPKYKGRKCEGDARIELDCNTIRCAYDPLDGNWGGWSDWSRCEHKCSNKFRTRACNDPAPKFGGKMCEGDPVEERECFPGRCPKDQKIVPVDGNWGPWGRFTRCTRTCGGGVRERYRECNRPQPRDGGKECEGDGVDEQPCATNRCPANRKIYVPPVRPPTDGQWGKWAPWGRCSRSCDSGRRIRTRKCDSPAPYRGRYCVGSADEEEVCNKQRCTPRGYKHPPGSKYYKPTKRPTTTRSTTEDYSKRRLDGNWGRWGRFGPCSRTCGGGTQTRGRSCDDPKPQNGGRDCYGSESESRQCNTRRCPVIRMDGNWGNWGVWGTCSKSCGRGGTHTRIRRCDNPRPANGGSPCRGNDIQKKSCYEGRCPARPATPSPPPTRVRPRVTSRPRTRPTRPRRPQRVDGNWGEWGEYTQCSRSCGGGSQMRRRSCNNPAPSYGGRRCAGRSYEYNYCNRQSCQATRRPAPTRSRRVDGNWGNWGRFSACSRSCGGGRHYRTRTCDSPRPSYGGRRCSGNDRETKSCNTDRCPARRLPPTRPPPPRSVDGNWGQWGRFSACSRSCGGGRHYRTRTCDNPRPSYGGRRCSGNDRETKSCNTDRCPGTGGSSSGSSSGTCVDKMNNCRIYKRYCRSYKSRLIGKCDKTCGYCSASTAPSRPSTPSRYRPQPSRPRAVNGNWGSWGRFGACSKSCGGGVQTKRRLCNSPSPSNGGRSCAGSSSESRRCSTNRCPAVSNRSRRPSRPSQPAPSGGGGSSSSLRVCDRKEALKCYGYERRRAQRCKGGPSWFTKNCDFMCGKCTVKPSCDLGDEPMCGRHYRKRRLACSRSWMIKVRCPNMCKRCNAGPKTLEEIIYRRR